MDHEEVCPSRSKVWLVTGASRGIGLQIVLAALSAGDYVVAGARDVNSLSAAVSNNSRLLNVALDVTDADNIATAVTAAVDRFGGIDVLVNCAGYGQLGAFEEQSRHAIHAQFATNVFGAFDVTRAVLPIMRSQRSGHIISISSISGLVGCKMASIYCSSKFALTGWAESVSSELAPFGISVTTVYPGTFQTDFFHPSSMRTAENPIEDYLEANALWVDDRADPLTAPLGNPATLGRLIVLLSTSSNPPSHLVVGTDAVSQFQARTEQIHDAVHARQDVSAATDSIAAFETK